MKFSDVQVGFTARPINTDQVQVKAYKFHRKGNDFLRPSETTVPVSKIIKVYVQEQFQEKKKDVLDN